VFQQGIQLRVSLDKRFRRRSTAATRPNSKATPAESNTAMMTVVSIKTVTCP
jgi:hypothetical protein